MRRPVVAVAVLVLGSLASGQTELFTRIGDAAGDQFGTAVASVGDLDADGAADFAVGAPWNNVPANDAGMVRVYSGRTLLPLYTWRGTAAHQRFGNALAAAGDVDGDAHGDVVVGAPGGSYAVVFSGATGSVLYTLSAPTGAEFGQSVAGGDDLDGDGVPDLLIGAPRDSTNAAADGSVFVYSGATGAFIRKNAGSGAWQFLGWSATFLGDLDGDGRAEYAGGEPSTYIGVIPIVRAYDGATGVVLWTSTATGISDQLGWSLARSADLTGDGKNDLLIGAPQDPGVGCACQGRGYVRAVNGVTGAQIYQINNTTGIYVGFGFAVTSMGDLDGNGYEDFAASRPGTEGCGGTSALALQVRDGQSGALLLSLAPPSGSQQFGSALASGDANGDGLRDLLCGAPCSNSNGTWAGSVHVYTIVRTPTVYCASETNSLGCAPSIAGVGTPSATLASPFEVRATNVLNNKSGLCFYGFKPRQTPFQGGHMCVVAPTVRTAIQSSGGTGPPANDCSGVFTLDFNARIQSGVDPLLVAGKEIFGQYWSRDPQDASTTNLTNALAFYVNP